MDTKYLPMAAATQQSADYMKFSEMGEDSTQQNLKRLDVSGSRKASPDMQSRHHFQVDQTNFGVTMQNFSNVNNSQHSKKF